MRDAEVPTYQSTTGVPRRYLIPSLFNQASLESFFVAAVVTLLLTRFYLYLTGFPKVGGNGLHIAHMLWGGLLMVSAIVLLLTYVGGTAARWASIVGGAGFGLFIDELGKFITSDTNYFFKPAAAIIYVVFMLLYFAIYLLLRRQHVSGRTQLHLGLQEFMEAAAHSFDVRLVHRTREYLSNDPSDSQVTSSLIALLDSIPETSSHKPGPIHRLRVRQQRRYEVLLRASWFPYALVGAYSILALAGIVSALLMTFGAIPAQQRHLSSGYPLHVSGALVGSVVSAALIFVGDAVMLRSRLDAYTYFRLAMLVSIFVTTLFEFYSIQFYALIGLAIALFGLIVSDTLIARERQHRLKQTFDPAGSIAGQRSTLAGAK